VQDPSILVIAFGPDIDCLGSARGGFRDMSRVVVLSILEESVAESCVHQVSPTCCYGPIFWQYRAEVTIKDGMFIPRVWH
jgi:hypothetical protein